MCGYGGIGRRAGLRIQSMQMGAGSNPVIRIKFKPIVDKIYQLPVIFLPTNLFCYNKPN